MYSKNDYRYYLEHRLAESNDYLAHYGVKGMKWKQHLKRAMIPKDLTIEKDGYKWGDYSAKGIRLDFDKHRGKDGKVNWSNGVGIQIEKNKKTGEKSLRFYNTRRVKLDNEGYAKIESKRKGRFAKSRGEDGVDYSIDIHSPKKSKKIKAHRTARQLRGEGSNLEWATRDAVRNVTKKR